MNKKTYVKPVAVCYEVDMEVTMHNISAYQGPKNYDLEGEQELQTLGGFMMDPKADDEGEEWGGM